MSDSDIETIMIREAHSFLTSGDAPFYSDSKAIAYENVKSNAANKFDEWSAVFYRPNVPVGITVGQNGSDVQTGFLQIDFNAPIDAGTTSLKAWEDKARVYFAAGNSFSFGSHYLTIRETGMGLGRKVDNHFRRSLTVAFRAHLKRQNTTN